MLKKVWPWFDRVSKAELFLVAVCIVGAFARFVGVTQGPPGFYIDEAAISAQVVCARQSGGIDVYGNSWPLFSQVLGGGYISPAYLYGGILWTSLFGDSIGAFRSFAAFFGLLTIVGVFFLARALWTRTEAAWFCALCAAVSPWGFLFSRIAWDPILAPCFLVWGFYFLMRSQNRMIRDGIFAGFLVAMAMYSYPPVRVQVVLMVPFAAWLIFKSEQLRLRKAVAFGLSVLACLVPLLNLTFNGTIQGRFNMLSIWNHDYLQQFGGFSISTVLRLFAENIAQHFSPRYLFLSGDANFRHSTQAAGQWSLLDIGALVAALVFAVRRKKLEARERLAALFVVASYFAGIVPAALTWESNPHSLRSIGAFPFLALGSGWVLYRLSIWKKQVVAVIAVAALSFFTFYFYDLLTAYPRRADLWFDTSIVQAASSATAPADVRAAIHTVSRDYSDLATMYYELQAGDSRCEALPFRKPSP